MSASPPPKPDKGKCNKKYHTTMEDLQEEGDEEQQHQQNHQNSTQHQAEQNLIWKKPIQYPNEEKPQSQYHQQCYQSTPY